MIEKSTLEYIKELQEENNIVFYNGVGHPDMYRNNIKHLSYAKSLGIIKLYSDNVLKFLEDTYVYSQNNQSITHYSKGDELVLIDLE